MGISRRESPHFAAMGFLPAMRAGMVDSLNPGGLTALLLFAIFLFFVAKRGMSLRSNGLLFILGVAMSISVVNIGILDSFLGSELFGVFLDVVYGALTIFSLLAAGALLKRWWAGKTHREQKTGFFSFSFETTPLEISQRNFQSARESFLKKIGRAFVRCGVVSLAGIMTAVVASAWPPDSYVVFMCYELSLPGAGWGAVGAFVLYGLAFALPLVFLWVTTAFVFSSLQGNAYARKILPKIQIIVAAVFLAYGVAFAGLYLREIIHYLRAS